MPDLASHANVHDSCLRLLRRWGYELEVRGELDPEGIIEPGTMTWIGRRNGRELWGDNPVELLGLAALQRDADSAGRTGNDWWVVPGGPVRDELLERCFGEEEA